MSICCFGFQCKTCPMFKVRCAGPAYYTKQVTATVLSTPGPQGPKGDKGDKGDPGEVSGGSGGTPTFPDTVPAKSVLSYTIMGFGSISLSWTFEKEIYYAYELYGAMTPGFTPSADNLLYQGQASAYLHVVQPGQTWYYRVRGYNTFGHYGEFSDQLTVTTTKISDMENYIEKAAIGEALIGTLRADRAWVGKFQGHSIDARELSVTDGNGTKTLEIDSFGNVKLDVASLKIQSQGVMTEGAVQAAIKLQCDAIDMKVESLKSQESVDIISNGDFSEGLKYWTLVGGENSNVVSTDSSGTWLITSTVNQINVKQTLKGIKGYTRYLMSYNLASDDITHAISTTVKVYQDANVIFTKTFDDRFGSTSAPCPIQLAIYIENSALDTGAIQIGIEASSTATNNIFINDVKLLEPNTGNYVTTDQFAKFKMTVDGVSTSVQKINKDMELLSGNVNVLADRVSANYNKLSKDMTEYNTQYNQTAEEIKTTATKAAEDGATAKSIATQTANQISTQLTTYDTKIGNLDSKITQTSSSLNSSISQTNSEVGKLSSSVTQLSSQISSKVSANDVQSIIQQKPDSIQIGFNKISNRVVIADNGLTLKNDSGTNVLYTDSTGKLHLVALTSADPANPIIKLLGDCSLDATKNNEQGVGSAVRLKWNKSNYYYIGVDTQTAYQSGVATMILEPSRVSFKPNVTRFGGAVDNPIAKIDTNSNYVRVYRADRDSGIRIDPDGAVNIIVNGNTVQTFR